MTFHRKTCLTENSVFAAFETPHKWGFTVFQTLRKLVWNALQTLRKLLTNARKAFQTLFKPFVKRFAKRVKRFSNPLQMLLKSFANALQTLEGRRNQSTRNKTRLAMNCCLTQVARLKDLYKLYYSYSIRLESAEMYLESSGAQCQFVFWSPLFTIY